MDSTVSLYAGVDRRSPPHEELFVLKAVPVVAPIILFVEAYMDGIIYLVGLVVIVMFILSVLGLR